MKYAVITAITATLIAGIPWNARAQESPPPKPSAVIGTFPQEVHVTYTTQEGLPDNDVLSVAAASNGTVYAGTVKGLAQFTDGKWTAVQGAPAQPVPALTADGNRILFAAGSGLYALTGTTVEQLAPLPGAVATATLAAKGDLVLLGAEAGLFRLRNKVLEPDQGLLKQLKNGTAVRQIAIGPGGMVYVAAKSGLFHSKESGVWEPVYPSSEPMFPDPKKELWIAEARMPDSSVRAFPRGEPRSWAPLDVRGAGFDRKGRLWFASPNGAGCLDAGRWLLYTGREGLPYNDFTTVAAAEDGAVWFGTHFGAIKYDGSHWAYRQGRRWLLDDDVRAMAVTKEGHAWFATSKGLSLIERRPMTLAQKAAHYEDLIDRFNRRTEYEYVLEASLEKPGDLSSKVTNHDSDNDGLWTSMYGAGECFAYAATKDPKAKERAKKAFEALRFLRTVSETGSHPAPKGFFARTILPTSGPDPNKGRIEGDKRQREQADALWKVYEPRWPVSADGKWYWKSDTSSDEVDGHYFFYPLYYDLVCETEEEKAAVREHVRAITDHIIAHNFNQVDHTGTPTRWSIYNPEDLNHNIMWWDERGLKSLSILSYLAVAEHVTGDPKYGEALKMLCEKHSYHTNAMVSKIQRGVGSGNQSDDEMGFMCFYNIIKYAKDDELRMRMRSSLYQRWVLEAPEMNPLFNFIFVASCWGAQVTNPWGTHPLIPWDGWLEDSMDTLKRFPLDRFDWRHTNSHRLDIIPLPRQQAAEVYEFRFGRKGMRVNGKVIPADECHFNHWNRDPFELDTGGGGNGLATGAVFTLPYYMGLYHGFITEQK